MLWFISWINDRLHCLKQAAVLHNNPGNSVQLSHLQGWEEGGVQGETAQIPELICLLAFEMQH